MAPNKLLIVVDDPGVESQRRPSYEDYDGVPAEDRVGAINELRRHEPPVVLQDLGLSTDDSGVQERFATHRDIVALAPHTKVVVGAGYGDRSNAVRAVGLGAHDFYHKPVAVDILRLIVALSF